MGKQGVKLMANIPTNIPGTPGPGGIASIPGVRMGVNASAADFGSENFRNWQRLARTVGYAGETQMQWAIQKQNEQAEMEGNSADANARKEIIEARNSIFQTTGANAINVRQNMEKVTSEVMERYRSGLSTDKAKEYFDRSIRNFNLQNFADADVYTVKEIKRSDNVALEAQVEQRQNDSLAMVDNYERYVRNIDEMRSLVARRYTGEPREFIDLETDKAIMAMVEGGARKQAQTSAKAALDFLNSGIESELMTDGMKAKLGILRKGYEEANENAEIADLAMLYVDSGLRSDEAYTVAWDQWGDDKAKRDQFLSVFDNYRRRKVDGDNARAAQQVSDLWQQFNEAGRDVNNMTNEAKAALAANPDLTKAFEDHNKRIANLGGMDQIEPIFSELDRVYDMEGPEIRAWLSDSSLDGNGQSNWSKLEIWAAGRTDEVNRILKKSRGEESESRPGSGGGAGKFKVSDFFQNNYPSMYGGNLFLDGGNTAKTHQNGFELRFNDRVREGYTDSSGKAVWKGLQAEGRNPDDGVMREIAMGMTADVIAGRLDLDVSVYDEQKARETSIIELPVLETELTPQEQTIHPGRPVILRETTDGQYARFRKLDPSSIGSGIFEDVRAARPTSALIALQKGVWEKGLETGLSYEAGWAVVDMGDGYIKVYDQDWKEKGETRRVSQTPAGHTPSVAAPSPRAEPPPMSASMQSQINAWNEQYGQEKVRVEWTGWKWNIIIPGQVTIYSQEGSRDGSHPGELY